MPTELRTAGGSDEAFCGRPEEPHDAHVRQRCRGHPPARRRLLAGLAQRIDAHSLGQLDAVVPAMRVEQALNRLALRIGHATNTVRDLEMPCGEVGEI